MTIEKSREENAAGSKRRKTAGRTNTGRQAAMLRRLTDSVPVLLAYIDKKERYQYANNTHFDWFGLKPEEMVGKTLEQVFGRDVYQILRPYAKQALAGNETSFETELAFRQDNSRYLSADFEPHIDEQGVVQGYSALIRDITCRKELEQRLQQANKDLEQQVAARTARLERNLLRLRRMALELAQTEQRERARLARVLHDDLQQLLVAAILRIERTANLVFEPDVRKALGIVGALLEQAAVTAKSIAGEIRPPVLHEKSLLDSLQWLTGWVESNFDLKIRTTVGKGVATAEVPKEIVVFLFEATRELFFNIVKHAGVRNADLTVELSPSDGQRLILVIEDRGKGAMGNPLATGAASHQQRGFGLHSIRERIDLLGGQMEVKSELGKYFRTKIIFPYPFLGRPAPSGAAAGRQKTRLTVDDTAPETEVQKPVRVLLADDHKIVREGLALIIHEEPDLEVVGEAENGRQAVEIARKLQPDVVVMDVNMPEMNGIEATRAIRKLLPDVRIIGLSVNEDDSTARAMTRAGAAAYVRKNIPAEELCAVIRRCLDIGRLSKKQDRPST